MKIKKKLRAFIDKVPLAHETEPVLPRHETAIVVRKHLLQGNCFLWIFLWFRCNSYRDEVNTSS